jgi:hypothetical protein
VKIFNKLIPALLIITFLTPAKAQDGLEETLKDLLSQNAKGYLGPFVTAFGTGMNSGTFRRAKPHKILGFDFTLNVTLTTVAPEALTYDFYIPESIPFPFTDPINNTLYTIPMNGASLYPGDKTSSTFFGENQQNAIVPSGTYAFETTKNYLLNNSPLTGTQIDAIAGTIQDSIVSKLTIFTPPGIGWDVVPTLMPQFALGLPFGTEIMFRGFTATDPDGNEIKFGGFGAKLYLNKLLPTIPLVFPAISIGFYSTGLDMAGIITSKNSILTLQVSKSIPVFTLYGGFGIEKSSIEVNLDTPGSIEPLNFSIDGDNSVRAIIGLRIKLLLLSINVDRNFGEYTATNIGIGLTLR